MSVRVRLRALAITLALPALVLGLGTAATQAAYAQESTDPEAIPLRDRAWALQFNVGQNFTLDSFLGSTISAKRHTTAARAWQFGVTVGTQVQLRDNRPDRNDQFIRLDARYLTYPLLGD